MNKSREAIWEERFERAKNAMDRDEEYSLFNAFVLAGIYLLECELDTGPDNSEESPNNSKSDYD